MRRFATILVLAVASGCAFHHAPYVTYEGDVPLAETAVFVAQDEKATLMHVSRVRAVDGKGTSCAQVGCPFWVRVLPGSHSFSVEYTSQWTASRHQYANLDVAVADMKPRHVYVVRYREKDESVQQAVEDLGENPDFGLELRAGITGTARYRAEF